MSGDNVDERVVEMNFNNDQFEKGIDESLKSIDRLKKGLDLKDAAKSLDNLESAGNRFTLANIGKSIEHLGNEFSFFEQIATQALGNIVGDALQAGISIVESLTLKPAEMGFQEYETQMGAIQTIMANTSGDHTVLKNVTDALDILNTYSDKTIYNFTQMTRNIGTFTAADIKLDASVSAIKGIANLAAVSGSNADQASTAMYQLSQALAAGSLKLQDWNSVVNAGMGGKIFQEALMQTARVHGVAVDQIVKDEGSFRESLKKGWITSEILTETLSKFTGDLTETQLKSMGYTEDQIKEIVKMGKVANDAATKVKTITQLMDTLAEATQSGWTKSFQFVIGDFNEATNLMTEISDTIGAIISQSSDARNEILQSWNNLGGRNLAIEALRQGFDDLMRFIKPVQEAFQEIFPPATGMDLYNLTLNLKNLIDKLKMGEETAAKVKSVFKGFFALIDIGKMAVLALLKSFSGLNGPLGDAAKNLLDWLANGGDWIVKLRDQIKNTDAFGKAIEKVKDFLKEAGEKIKTFVDIVSKYLSRAKEFFQGLTDKIKIFVDQFRKSFSSLGKVDTKGLGDFLDKLKERFKPLAGLGDLLWKIFGIAGKALLVFQKLAIQAMPFLVKIGSKAADGISGFLDGLIKTIENFDFNKFFDLLNAGLLTGLLLTIKKFIKNGGSFFDEVSGAFGENGFLGKITGIFDGVRESLEAYQKNLQSGMLLKIAAAIGILAISLVAISMIDSKKLTASLAAMTVMFIQLGVSLTVLDKMTSSSNLEDMGKLAVGLLGLSAAILVMSGAVLLLGKMKTDELGRGLAAVGLLTAMLVSSSVVMAKGSGDIIKTSLGLVIFAGSLLILVSAVERLSKLDIPKLTSGLIGIGVLCLELVLFMKSTDMNSMGIAKSVGILILAGALEVLAFAVEKLANIDGDKLLRGLLAVGVVLAEVSIFVNSTSNATQVITTSVALVILSGAMLIMTDVLTKLGQLSWEQIGKGLVAMGGALVVIGIAADLLPKDLLGISASLVVMATALLILSKALGSMGNMSWESIGKSLVTMGGALLILAIGLRAMTGTLAGVAALMLASVALALMAPALKLMGSMDIAAIGGSLLLLAGIFLIFGVAATALSETIPVILALAASLVIMGAAVFLLGAGVAAVGLGILALATAATAASAAGAAGITLLIYAITGIVGLIPMIAAKLGEGLLALLQVLVAGFPLILQAIEILLLGIVDILVKIAPPFVKAVWELVNSVLKTIDANLPSIIQSGVSIILALMKGINDNIGKITSLAYDIAINFLKALEEKIPELVNAGYTFIISLINGMTDAVDKHMPELMVAVTKLSLAIIQGLIQGWLDSSAAIRQGMWNICMVVIQAVKDALGIHSPSTVFTDFGTMTIQGLINGIQNMIGALLALLASLISQALMVFDQTKTRFLTAGATLITSVISGIVSLKEATLAKISEILSASLSIINTKYQEFKKSGTALIQGIVDGAEQIRNKVIQTASSLVNSARDKIHEGVDQFVVIGNNVVEGFANGIGDYIYKAVEQANNLASEVLKVIRSVLGINSPSDETEDDAMNLVLGMVGGFKKYGDLAYNAAKDLGKKTLSGLSSTVSSIADAVDTSLNSSPTIKPVLDLSAIQQGGNQINSMFGSKTIDVSSSVSTGNSIAAKVNPMIAVDTTSDPAQQTSQSGGVTYNQYNTSPKALSPLEIYRQTKNQLSSLKKQAGVS